MQGKHSIDEGWNALFTPQHIAVIGASSSLKKPGGIILQNLLNGHFTGKIYPVNTKHEELFGLPCFKNINSIPHPVDLAVISVQSNQVLNALKMCGHKGVKAAVIFSSGFGEIDEAGLDLQNKLEDTANTFGIRLCGPNSMGINNYFSNLHASFAYGFSQPAWEQTVDAGIALISQSGGVGCNLLSSCASFGLGVTFFVSSGNEAATDYSDYISYFAKHPRVKIIAGYMEGITNGEKFRKAAEEALSNRKPLVILKTGRYGASARAASSHTGSLAGSYQVFRSLFRQKSIIEVDSIDEMLSVISLLASGKEFPGNKAAIMCSSGGQAVMIADKLEASGLSITELSLETREKLMSYLPSYAATANPVDFTGFDIIYPGVLKECTSIVAADPAVDLIVISHWISDEVDSIGQFIEIARQVDQPLVIDNKTIRGVPTGVVADLIRNGISFINNMESCGNALMSVYRHFRIKDNNAPHMDTPTFQIQKVPNVLGEALTDNEAKTLLEKYQVPVVPELKAFTLEEAVNAAEEIGYPVVMKINAREIIHKTEAKGVHLHLRDSKQVASSFKEITNEIHLRHPDIHVQGVTVQKMLEEGVETLVGLYRDPVFGLVLVFGLGGIWVEVIQDVSMRVLPVTDDDIKEMIYEIKAYPVLAGARGKYLLDIDSIVKTIKCITQLGVDNPNLQELDINPLYILPEGRGIFVVDSLIIL